jgi:MFS family permease
MKTPTGYRCRECVRERRRSFETSEWYDFIVGGVVAAFLSGIASALVTAVGGIGFFGWFLIAAGAPIAATVISEGVRAATRKRRSRALFITVALGVVIGAVPVILFQLFIGNLFGIVYQAIYLVIAVPTVYARLSGIQLFR